MCLSECNLVRYVCVYMQVKMRCKVKYLIMCICPPDLASGKSKGKQEKMDGVCSRQSMGQSSITKRRRTRLEIERLIRGGGSVGGLGGRDSSPAAKIGKVM